MNIANSASVTAVVNSASSGEPGSVRVAASMLVLKQALQTQAEGAVALLNALPQQPALTTEGNIGRHVNTFV
ncbi:putative motility protein [Roseateles sp. DXS20W]|uniref:Motility protein n=1 Tax=Pelomonas lactea TaxID=3299030 RepID=A0ABW7GLB9_9BURK